MATRLSFVLCVAVRCCLSSFAAVRTGTHIDQPPSIKLRMDLYYLDISPPCRAVLLTAKHLNVDVNIKVVDLFKGEHLSPEFVALNPEHTIPTLVVDKDFVLWESTAIQRFLVNQYAKDDSLYPKDPRKRAQIDRLLHFSSGTLVPRFGKYLRPILFKSAKPDPEALESALETFGWLDSYLKENTFAVGDSITLADYSLAPVLTQAKATDLCFDSYPNITRWYKTCKETIPDFETLDMDPAQKFGNMIREKLQNM